MNATKNKESRSWRMRKSLTLFCIILVLLVFCYVKLFEIVNNHTLISSNLNARVLRRAGVVTNTGSNVTVSDAVYRRYQLIRRDYTKKLSSIPIITYKPSKMFIDFGQPVKNYLPRISSKPKLILGWTDSFSNKRYIPLKLECGNSITCETTYDRNDLLKSDAIVMHAHTYSTIVQLPTQRLPHQRWVHFDREPPYHLKIKPVDFNGLFNYTMTYRHDSDSPSKYVLVSKRKTPLLDDQFASLFTEILESKSKLISHMSSNCAARQTIRLSYVRELQKYIPIDTYGRCGKLKCVRNSKECEKTMSSYKFYLSMENSHCRNYVTEKPGYPLFNWRAVPIVMGGADPSDYERALPPESYIHTAGFNSTKALAEYLLILDKNPALYERYHEWRKNYTGQVRQFYESWCNLCRKLHNDSLPVQTYRDFKGWYDQDTCHI